MYKFQCQCVCRKSFIHILELRLIGEYFQYKQPNPSNTYTNSSMDFSLAHDPKLKGVDDLPNLGMITRLHMANSLFGLWLICCIWNRLNIKGRQKNVTTQHNKGQNQGGSIWPRGSFKTKSIFWIQTHNDYGRAL